MTETGPQEENPQSALPEDDGRTLVIDSGEAFTMRSAAQWREHFDISEGNELSDYGKLRTLGMGGMGVVFEAHDPALKRPVALKLLRPQYRGKEANIERFIREARITAQIDHPNVVSVQRVGFFDDVGIYFTMKRVQGRTLKRVLEKLTEGDKEFTAQYPLRHLIQIFISICNGIAAAHERGILHCDLKPANVMVGNFGQVFVMDWGIAREISAEEREEKVAASSAPHSLEGTPVFMAPELISGELAAPDRQSDLYSLGAILWCILTKKAAPFDASMKQEKLLPLIASGAFPRPSRCAPKGEKIPAELEAIVLKAMARDRKMRYAGVSELLADLYRYMDGYPVTAYSPNIFYRAVKLIRRRPLVPLTLLAALITAGVFAGTLRLIEYVNNKSLSMIARTDFSRSVEGMQLASRHLQRWKDNADHLPDVVRERRKQRLLFELRNSSADLFDAFNAVSRFSREEQRRFLLSGGSDTFRKLLQLQLEYEPESLAGETVKRFSRQYPELYRLARSVSSRLDQLIRRIQMRTGILQIHCDPAWKCVVYGAKNVHFVFDSNLNSMEVPSGNYKVDFMYRGKVVMRKNIRVPLGLTACCSSEKEDKSKD